MLLSILLNGGDMTNATEPLEKSALPSYLSSDDFRALIGAIKVLGKLDEFLAFEAKSIESRR